MTKLEGLIEKARGLSSSERQRLLAEIKRSLEGEAKPEQTVGTPYAALLSLAGTASSEFSNVSADKYDHVAEPYSPKQRELDESIAEADRGDVVSAAELFRRLSH